MADKKPTTKSGGKKKSKARGKRSKKHAGPEPIYKAIFGKRARVSPAKRYGRNTKRANSFAKILGLVRVQQDVNRSALERKASGTCAVNMCKRHKIEMAEVLEEIEWSKNKHQGSSSTVIIKHANKNKTTSVRTQTFLVDICDAIEMMFDCEAFTELRNSVLRVTFFGIAGNTISAQLAFKLVYNQAVNLGVHYKGNGPRNSYLLGLGKGLWERAMRRKLRFEEDIKKAQEMAATTFADEEFEPDDDYEPDFDFDSGSWKEDIQAIDAEIKAEDSEGVEGAEGAEGAEDNAMALVCFNPDGNGEEAENSDDEEPDDNESDDEDEDYSEGSYNWVLAMLAHNDYRTKVKQTAASWLKDNRIKLRSLGKRRRNIRFPELFEQGKEDSNDVDLGEKRIGDVLRLDLESQATGQLEGEVNGQIKNGEIDGEEMEMET